MNYRLVIPCAGVGSRVSGESQGSNKALILVAGKPVIAHIIEKIPTEIEVVVILGYDAERVRSVVTDLFQSRKIHFVTVDVFEGDCSGPGRSLRAAEQLLQCPFVVFLNDTIADFDRIEPDCDWLGVRARPDVEDMSQYYSVEITPLLRVALDVHPKGGPGSAAYIGACGVFNYEDFWAAMHDPEAVLGAESYAIMRTRSLVQAREATSWYDTGNMKPLVVARQKLGQK